MWSTFTGGQKSKEPPIFESDNHCVVYLCALWTVDVRVLTT